MNAMDPNVKFGEPTYLTFDGAKLLIADTVLSIPPPAPVVTNARIRSVDTTSSPLPNPVDYGALGLGDGQFTAPEGIGVEPGSGRYFIADAGNNRIVRIDGITGGHNTNYGNLGSGNNGQFNGPTGIFVR